MKHRAQADADLRVHHAVQLALADPRPNPFYAAFAALWAGSHVPTDSEIKATWALVAEQLNAANRLRIEEQLRGSIPEDKGERRRLRAELRRGVLPPPWPAPAVAPVQAASERRELLESYTVDTDPQTFLRMHHEYEKARRAQRPVRYLVHRKGEPPTVELHPPPPLSPKPRRPGVVGHRGNCYPRRSGRF